MNLIYNDFDFSTIGELTIKQRTDYEGGDAPQRARVVLDVGIDIFQRTYTENYALIQKAVAALELPNAVLQWVNSDTGENYINQTATIIGSNAPEDWGTYFQRLELQFYYYQAIDTDQQNLPMTFTPDGGQAMAFDNVVTWKEGASTERFDPKRSERIETIGKIFVAGFIYGDTTLPLATRQQTFAGILANYRTAMNSAQGTLQFGTGASEMFSGEVRISDFECDVDQPTCAIRFSFNATYTLFPDEEDYATVEATAEQKDELNTGQVMLTISGKIQGSDEPTARAKMAVVVAAMLKQYAYTNGQKIEFTSTPNLISANSDGDTFTELTFGGSWRKWKSSNQTASFAGGSATGQNVSLGNVTAWQDGLRSERFDVMRPQRRNTVCTITAGGTWAPPGAATVGAPGGATVTTVRAAVLAQFKAMKQACNAASGTLVYGVFNQVVRVESFDAKINQAETGIDWTLSCNYVLFPGTSYATVEATAQQQDGFTGEKILIISGKIQASDQPTAETKLEAVIASFVTQYNYSAGQLMQRNTTPNLISANEDGVTFTELSFSVQWRKWKTSNQTATFQAAEAATPVTLPNVRLWDQDYKAERFDPMRSERRLATGSISAAGTIPGDMRLPGEKRRAALVAIQQQLNSAVNCADGTLVFGSFSQVVRVEDFIAHINQAETGIDWAMTASYSVFPNEGGYATCSFTAETRNENETGDQFLTFSGTIEAPNGAFARAKLATLRTSVLGIYGFATTSQTRATSATVNIDANGDKTAGVKEGIETENDSPGSSMIRLTFNEEYRQRIPGSIISSRWQVDSRDDTTTGLVLTTYSGTVVATGPTENAAIAAAVGRAMQIGGVGGSTTIQLGPSAFLRSQTLTFEKRQLNANNPEEFLQLTFAYEYQSKLPAGRAYMEVNTQTQSDTFGADSENVSGFVIAVDFPTATTMYQQQVKSLYAGMVILNESVTQAEVNAETVSTLSVPTDTFVFNTQPLKLEFSLSVRTTKPPTRVGARYAIQVNRDVRNLRKTSQISGDVFAVNKEVAESFVGQLLSGFSLGSNMSGARSGDHELLADTSTNPGTDADVLTRWHFEEGYESALTGITGVIEMEITETVSYSGIRWVVQDTPFQGNGGGGYSIVQPCGIKCGSRTVRGWVTAATLATAQAWALQQQSMLTGDAGGNHYPEPPDLENGYQFVPRVNGIPQGENENVRIFKVSFTFGELLPNYPAPA